MEVIPRDSKNIAHSPSYPFYWGKEGRSGRRPVDMYIESRGMINIEVFCPYFIHDIKRNIYILEYNKKFDLAIN